MEAESSSLTDSKYNGTLTRMTRANDSTVAVAVESARRNIDAIVVAARKAAFERSLPACGGS